MKKIIILLYCFLSLACFSYSLRSATEYDYPPFSVTNEGTADGFSVDLLKAVADEMNLKLTFKIDQWSIIKEELKKGKLDVLPLMSYNEERAKYYDFTVPYIIMHGNIFVRNDNTTINSEEALKGKEIIVMQGDTAQEYAEKMKFTDKLILTKTYMEAFKLLSAGKHDAILAQSVMGLKMLNDLNIKNIKTVTYSSNDKLYGQKVNLHGFEQKFCFAVKKGDSDLLSKLNEGLAVVVEKGIYQNLYEKWFPFLLKNEISFWQIIIYVLVILIPLLIIFTILYIVIMKKQIKKKTDELEKESYEKNKIQNQMNAILKSAFDGYVLVDSDSKVLQVNDSYIKMSGYTKEEILELSVRNLEYVDDENKIKDRMDFIKSNGPVIFESVHIRKDRTVFPVEVSVNSILDNENIYFSCFIRDISERKKYENELKKAKDTAELASTYKTEFLANMSHEIRTPMNGIIGVGQVLAETELTDEQKEFLDMIMLSSEKLLSIINDILDLSKIEAGKIIIESKSFNIKELIERMIDTYKISAQKKGLELMYDIPIEMESYYLGDAGKINQILVNLVGNAIKFTEKGEIFIGCNKEFEEGNKVMLRISVKDTGIGIPKENLKNIFDNFVQGDLSRTKRYEGTGLGLAISKRFTELMGGQIYVESTEGKGSTFSFTINLKKDETKKETDLLSLSKVNLKKQKVLIIDDNSTNRFILEKTIDKYNGRHLSAGSGKEGLSILEKDKDIKIILLDLNMADMDGMEVFRKIKSRENYLIVMLTSVDIAEYKERCKELGIDYYLIKPVKPKELIEMINKLFLEKEAVLKMTQKNEYQNGARKNVLVAEDNEINFYTIKVNLEKIGLNVVEAKNGIEAVRKFKETPVDLILMDLQMPELNGIDATKAIRKMDNGKDIPIIALTAYAMKSDRDECIDAGMNDYIAKPFDQKEFRSIVKKWIDII